MRFFFTLIGMSFIAATVASMAADPAADTKTPTKATYLITGLHCPPCTKTVESSLAQIRGVRAAKVDWKTKSARIEFDENLLPAQTLAQRIAATPHMMGAVMQYSGWLMLNVPEVKEEAAAKRVKEALGGIKGVKQVAVYPKQQTVAVQFDAAGRLTSGQLIDKLNDAGLKAGTDSSAEPARGSQSMNRMAPQTQVAQADPHAGMKMDHSKMDMPNNVPAAQNHAAMNHAGMDHVGMGHMMGGCSMCMQMMGMNGMSMNGMSMPGMANGVRGGAAATARGYGGGLRSGCGGCL